MINIVLYEPEIPPNTGNIIRLCANTGANLHLIKPLGFAMDDKKLRRAGLDYDEFAKVQYHESYQAFVDSQNQGRIFACSTKGSTTYTAPQYQAGDSLVFGPETRGLPLEILKKLPSNQVLRLPMTEKSRSLNLSNCVAIFLYEAWRQLDFAGGQ